MAVLIYSTREDIHASAVQWGLNKLSTDCVFWSSGEFPRDQKISINVSGADTKCVVKADGRDIDFTSLSAFWYRRGAPPQLNPAIDERDRDYAAQQSKQHIEALLSVACPQALWVNPPHVAVYEVNKPYQLQMARKLGLAIPGTLCSNDPDEVRSFCQEYGGILAFKSYKMGTWIEGGRTGSVFVGYTSVLGLGELSNDATILASPGVFQQLISRNYEIRTTFIGSSAFSVSIAPPRNRSGDVDWRSCPVDKLVVKSYLLPKIVENKLRKLKDKMGMVICTFDLIVDYEGEYVFIEANQMGQFLWKEELVPDLHLLDAMCRLLKSGDPNFYYEPSNKPLKYRDFLSS